MNADLIARLRAYPTRDGVEAADALESLEQQVAAQQAQMYEDRRQALVWRDQVAASQAREAKLREALKNVSCSNFLSDAWSYAREELERSDGH